MILKKAKEKTMKTIFLLSLIALSTLMGMDPSHKGIEIPGALRPSEDSHSPVASQKLDTPPSFYLERLANQYAQKIATAALEHYHLLISRGFQPGSSEVTKQLLQDHQNIRQQLAENEKHKKDEKEKKQAERKLHELELSTNACALHLAATINAGIAFHNETNKL
jgi:hypothetical protein